MSFLIAEQNINVALNYASRRYVLNTGRVVLSGGAEPLLRGAICMTFTWANSKG